MAHAMFAVRSLISRPGTQCKAAMEGTTGLGSTCGYAEVLIRCPRDRNLPRKVHSYLETEGEVNQLTRRAR